MCVVTIASTGSTVVWVHELAQVYPRYLSAESYTKLILTLAFQCSEQSSQIAVIHQGAIGDVADLYKTIIDVEHPLNALANSPDNRRLQHRNGVVDIRLLNEEGRVAGQYSGLRPCKIQGDGDNCVTMEQSELCAPDSGCPNFAVITFSGISPGWWIARLCFDTSASISELKDKSQIFPIHGPGNVLDALKDALAKSSGAYTANVHAWVKAELEGERPLLPAYDVSVVGEPGAFRYDILQRRNAEPDWYAILPWFNPTQTAGEGESVFFRTFTPESPRFSISLGAMPMVGMSVLPEGLSWDEIKAITDGPD
jgi:hypothetical protein